uniref:Uncharacterized protein n=1 Tax=Thiomonas intermedia (strain K12) TaxID=75379 RepID=D5X4Y1_THIK1
MNTAHPDAARQARIAALRAAVAREQRHGSQDLPAALQADLQGLRAAGLDFTILPGEPTPKPAPRPARTITAAEVAGLDARDPMRTLHQYQRAYAALGKSVPVGIVENLRAAARDQALRRQP